MRFDSSAKFALLVAAAALVASGLGFQAAVKQLNVYLRKEPVPLRAPLATMPTTAGPWKQARPDIVLSSTMVEELGTPQYLDRLYERDGKKQDIMQFHVAYYTGMIDGVPHVPERCWVAGGLDALESPTGWDIPVDRSAWRADTAVAAEGVNYPVVDVIDPITRLPEPVHMPLGDFVVTAAEYQNKLNPEERVIGGYFFIANGRIATSGLGVRTLAFSPTQRHAYYCKVQFAMPCRADDPKRKEKFIKSVGELLDRLLPPLMRRLPDWPSVERGEVAPPPTTDRAT